MLFLRYMPWLCLTKFARRTFRQSSNVPGSESASPTKAHNNRVHTTSQTTVEKAIMAELGNTGESVHSDMGCRDFWQNKYLLTSSNGFDWFFKSEEVVDNLRRIISDNMTTRTIQTAHILDLGCGTSLLPVALYRELRKMPHQTVLHCFDFASNAISFQRKTFLNNETDQDYIGKNKGIATEETYGHFDKRRHRVNFVVGDALRLPYADNFFEIIIDKGTVDSILRSKDPERLSKAQALILQAVTCLSQGGVLLQISDEDPDSRISLIEDSVRSTASRITVTHIKLNTATDYDYFMYFIVK